MKKLLIVVCCMIGLTGIVAAQTARKKAPAATKIEKVKPSAAVSAATKPLKKDGTPDNRFTVNKNNRETAAGPLKKDGTPDRRFKRNKTKKG